MSDCKCEEYKDELDDLKHRIGKLEDFKEWAEPLLDKIKTIDTSIKWMIVIFIGCVSISGYVYQAQISPYFEKRAEDKIEIIKEIHNLENKFNDKIEQSIRTSNASLKRSIKKMGK